jgi:hypothetical protein
LSIWPLLNRRLSPASGNFHFSARNSCQFRNEEVRGRAKQSLFAVVAVTLRSAQVLNIMRKRLLMRHPGTLRRRRLLLLLQSSNSNRLGQFCTATAAVLCTDNYKLRLLLYCEMWRAARGVGYLVCTCDPTRGRRSKQSKKVS